jgi:MerR family transcriptional regulator, light-induced transcriptional regulator
MYKYIYTIMAMTNDTDSLHFPIRDLVQRTGVNASTLRAWETRHGLLKPQRAPSGHRLYSLADVQRVQRLQELLAQGLSLADVVPILEQEGTSRVDARETTRLRPENPVWNGYLQETLRALEDFSVMRLDNLYNEACALYPIDLVTRNLLVPVLEHLGLRWDKRDSGIAEEHFFSAWLRNKLGARLHHSLGLPRGKPLILACLPFESHEIGLLLCALGLLQLGHRAIYLGASMPTRQIVHVSRSTHALGIVLTGRETADPLPSLADIAWLVEASDVPVFIGSHYSVRMHEELRRAGAIPVGDNLALGLHRIKTHLDAQAARQRRLA